MSVRRGADYVKALRDGREVWHAGQRIADVTAPCWLYRNDQNPLGYLRQATSARVSGHHDLRA